MPGFSFGTELPVRMSSDFVVKRHSHIFCKGQGRQDLEYIGCPTGLVE